MEEMKDKKEIKRLREYINSFDSELADDILTILIYYDKIKVENIKLKEENKELRRCLDYMHKSTQEVMRRLEKEKAREKLNNLQED